MRKGIEKRIMRSATIAYIIYAALSRVRGFSIINALMCIVSELILTSTPDKIYGPRLTTNEMCFSSGKTRLISIAITCLENYNFNRLGCAFRICRSSRDKSLANRSETANSHYNLSFYVVARSRNNLSALYN